MHRRILFGVVAWLLGAATATAGSLLAISLLGQGITGNSGQLLTQDAVNRALASEAAEAPPTPTAGGQLTAAPSAASSRATPSPTGTPATVAAPPAPAASSATTTAPDQADGTLLMSAGGEVVASCEASGAYLNTWSPSQGYEVSQVNRGPAATAQVTFTSTANQVTMVVSCSAGVPSATSYVRPGDD